MVIEYVLDELDLAEVRFAVSPLNELTFSLRSWRDPGRFPLHLPWLRRTAEARTRLDGDLLLALTNPRRWLPDFLSPRPTTPLGRIADELPLLAATDLATIEADFREIHADLPSVLRGDPAELRERITVAMTDYWQACFAPWWPRMQAILEADVMFRGRRIASHGLADMLSGLSPRITLTGNVLRARTNTYFAGFRRTTAGEGLTLVPSMFTRNVSTPLTPAEPPMLVYPARGVATLWSREEPSPGAVLVDLLGRTRAGLLVALEHPASSTELAIRLGVTPSAINQHLRTLHTAGLLNAARHGRYVLYVRSELGDKLAAG